LGRVLRRGHGSWGGGRDNLTPGLSHVEVRERFRM
jgi:hypothetical protein